MRYLLVAAVLIGTSPAMASQNHHHKAHKPEADTTSSGSYNGHGPVQYIKSSYPRGPHGEDVDCNMSWGIKYGCDDRHRDTNS